MDEVFGDADLLNEIFALIADPDPNVAARAIANWRAVNQTARAATEAEARGKWAALLRDGYKDMLMANSAKLATALSASAEHPLTYIKMLYKAYPYAKQWGPGSKRACLRVHFVSDMMHLYRVEKTSFPKRMRGLPLGKWVDLQWDALEPWQKAVYEACHPNEAQYMQRNGVRVWNQPLASR